MLQSVQHPVVCVFFDKGSLLQANNTQSLKHMLYIKKKILKAYVVLQGMF